jgi:hypothetical protein
MIALELHTNNGITQKLMPENWNELNQGQLLMIANSVFKEMSNEELRVRLVIILANLSLKELRRIEPEVMHEYLFPLTDWVMNDCDITEQKIPVLTRLFGRNFYGPSSELMNLRFCELDAAEQELYDWQQDTSKMEYLYRFVAVLYRPGKMSFKKGDITADRRVAFDQSQVARHARIIKRSVPTHKIFAILLWYKGCRQAIVNLYHRAFDPAAGDAEGGRPQYFPLMRMIAKEGIYGDIDKVEQMYVHTALMELEATIEEKEAAEAALKENQ